MFIVSAILHMVLKYHNADYRQFSNEDEVRAAIRKGNPSPGQYVLLYAMGPGAMKDPTLLEKFKQGPVGLAFLRKPGDPTKSMGPMMAQWFLYLLVVSFFVAYVAAHTVPAGSPYLAVFRVVGAVAFLAYAAARVQSTIWQGEPWSATIKDIIDGLIYGCVTAGTFGWLWPKV